MEYIDPECTLPVPFNIVPTPKFFYTCSKSITSKFSKQDDLPPVHHPGRIKDIEMFAQGNAFVRDLTVRFIRNVVTFP